jgi:hypothetical protein
MINKKRKNIIWYQICVKIRTIDEQDKKKKRFLEIHEEHNKLIELSMNAPTTV